VLEELSSSHTPVLAILEGQSVWISPNRMKRRICPIQILSDDSQSSPCSTRDYQWMHHLPQDILIIILVHTQAQNGTFREGQRDPTWLRCWDTCNINSQIQNIVMITDCWWLLHIGQSNFMTIYLWMANFFSKLWIYLCSSFKWCTAGICFGTSFIHPEYASSP